MRPYVHTFISIVLIITLDLLMLSGCAGGVRKVQDLALENFGSERWLPRPLRRGVFTGTPTKDDPYSVGFQHGCDTYAGIMGVSTYRMMTVKIDAHRLLNDPWYLRGYQDGATFCTFRLDWDTH